MTMYSPKINTNLWNKIICINHGYMHAQVIWLHENTPSGKIVLLYYITISVKWVPGTACKDFPFPFINPFFKMMISHFLLFLLNNLASFSLRKKEVMLKKLPVAHHAFAPYPAALWINNVKIFMSNL